jgi:HEAT repeat protein
MPVTTSLDHLITALRGKSESARRAAVEALVAQGSAAVKPLRDALADPHWEVRRAAVQALGRMGDPQATIAVFRMWEIGSHIIHLQQATVEAWERLKGTVAVEPLCGLLTDKDAAVRRAAVEALGQLNDPRAVKPLCSLLGDGDAAMREVTVAIVMRFPNEAFEPLLATLQNSSLLARLTAVGCLGQLSDPRAVEPLCRLLTDTDAAVRRAAVEGLGNIGRREALPALKARLHWLRGETDQNVLAALRAAIEKIEEATKHLKGKPRAGEVETPTPAGRPRAAGDAPTAEGRPRTTSDQ